ncbi:MAG: c-type cytochrome [Gammaproteobacteria bacterium]
MSHEEDKIFFRNYAIIIALLAVLIGVFLVLARIVGIDEDLLAKSHEATTAVNTAPVGQVRMEGDIEKQAVAATAKPAAATGKPVSTGEQIYSGLCVTCHGGNIPNIPHVGDTADWAPRIKQGMALLYEHALVGFTGNKGIMPARGGNPALTDAEVKAAVDYMVAQSR